MAYVDCDDGTVLSIRQVIAKPSIKNDSSSLIAPSVWSHAPRRHLGLFPSLLCLRVPRVLIKVADSTGACFCWLPFLNIIASYYRRLFTSMPINVLVYIKQHCNNPIHDQTHRQGAIDREWRIIANRAQRRPISSWINLFKKKKWDRG